MSASPPPASELGHRSELTRGAKTCHGPLPCACESDVALPQSCQRDVPRSYFLWWQRRCCRQASHSDVQFRRLFASRARARLRARHCEEQGNAVKLPRRTFLHLAAGAAALPFASGIVLAQTYPTRPVPLIVPIGPA